LIPSGGENDFYGTGVGERCIAIQFIDLKGIPGATLIKPLYTDEGMGRLVDVEEGLEKRFGLVHRGQLHLLDGMGAGLAFPVQFVKKILVVEICKKLFRAKGLGRGIGFGDRYFIGRLVIGPDVLAIAIDVLAAGNPDMVFVPFQPDGAALGAYLGALRIFHTEHER
jgi:hypothetical protein